MIEGAWLSAAEKLLPFIRLDNCAISRSFRFRAMKQGEGNMRLNDKGAVITGAGSGIGRKMAQVFASEGALVAAGDVNHATAEETIQSITSMGGRGVAIQ